jgi:hypothetical protein
MKRTIISLFIIGAAVFVAFYSAMQLGFYGDDWIFYDLAGRLTDYEYFVRYFDPNAQTAWYRPVQGVLWRIAYSGFGTNPFGYHLVNVILHFANCVLLFAILRRVTHRERISFFAALIFATLPTAAVAVLWPGVVDTLETFFCLLAIWLWVQHLLSLQIDSSQRSLQRLDNLNFFTAIFSTNDRTYWLAFGTFLLALLSKEIAVTLPVTLFLIDRCVIAKPTSLVQLARRYALFAVALFAYLPIEYIVTRRSVFISREGYSLGSTLVPNLLTYLGTLAFPWVFAPPFSYVWLAITAAVIAYAIAWKKHRALIPIVIGSILAILPVAPFPFIENRFLYMALIGSAILISLVLEFFASRHRNLALIVIAGVALFGGVSIARSATEFAENGRVARVSFRNVRQAHPTLPDDTLVYFIDPPVPGTNLSGMFLWYYGPHVFAGSNETAHPVNFSAHAYGLVNYFDNQGNQKEIRVDNQVATRALPTPPIVFNESIRLESYELASAHVKAGDDIALFLYWRASDRSANDHAVSTILLAEDGSIATQTLSSRKWRWLPGDLVVDPIIFPISNKVAPGTYRLSVSLIDSTNIEPSVLIEPIEIGN